MDKILFSPKEGTTGFRGLIDCPEKPSEYDFGNPKREGFRITEFFRAEEKYENALESCKSNSLEIVNPEVIDIRHSTTPEGVYRYIEYKNPKVLKPGDIFDLPEGYEFKEELRCLNSHCPNNYTCEGCNDHQPVLRLVKTESGLRNRLNEPLETGEQPDSLVKTTTKVKITNPFDVDILTWGGEVIKPGETKMVDVPVVNTETIKKMVSQYTPEELERRENHVATPTFPELEKAIENLTEEDMRKIQERVNKYLQTNKIPQPEPEESQILGDYNAWPLVDVLKELATAANILLKKHSYDGQRYEEIEICVKRANEIIDTIQRKKQ